MRAYPNALISAQRDISHCGDGEITANVNEVAAIEETVVDRFLPTEIGPETPMEHARRLLLLYLMFLAPVCFAREDLITTARDPNGEVIPYVLTYENNSPRYVIIVFPGGMGNVNPRMEDGKLVYDYRGNFVMRTRKLVVDHEFATVATNSTSNKERFQAILDDLKRRFPQAQIYLMGTSRGTFDTFSLSAYLSDKIAGVIHTASMSHLSSLNPKKYNNRHLLVHHKNDGCHTTPFGSAKYSHDKYGTDFIAVEGGIGIGNPCEAAGHHGFRGVERETIDAIKAWIKKGSN